MPLSEPSSPTSPRLLGDWGGTHVRLAWQAGPGAPPQALRTLAAADHPTPREAVEAYLAGIDRPRPREAALAVAGPVTGDRVRFMNQAWAFSVRELAQTLGLRRLRVLNDFTALALALPDLAPSCLRGLGGEAAAPGQAMALLGPGTGLGVSGLLPAPPGARWPWAPVEGEGGHVTLAATTAREFAVLQALAPRFDGHVSAERVLSGPGLVALYQALCGLDGRPAAPWDAAQVAAQGAQDAHAAEARDLFGGWLGQVAGDLALTLGARGGVFLGGGIVPRWGEAFARTPFRARFEAHGRYRAYLRPIPVWCIDSPVPPALSGAARALDLGAWGVAHEA